ncbi:dTMP kinase [Bacilli bacterium PM5-3]|nr:dTMP kinase [Bacilli bacterium PM5-3]MDH6603677.1 dTMP kinase [Bacilli bacterium PM5-9]
MKKSFFITFEGPDGSGKSTIIKKVAKYLDKNNYEYVLTREPGGSNIAEQIREIILDPKNVQLSASTEALLYAASRAQHFDEIIKPALDDSKIVICDRFLDSSLVYQGIARNLGVEEVLSINRFAIKDVLPDLTIFFDVDPVIGLERIQKSKVREINRLDLESVKFHQEVYDGYHKIIENDKKRFEIIDASQSIEKVFQDTIAAIKERYDG